MTFRFRLTLGLIAATMLAYAALSAGAVLYISRSSLHEVQKRVRLDLNAARRQYDAHTDRLAGMLLSLQILCGGHASLDAYRDHLDRLYQSLHDSFQFDVLLIAAADGRVIYRANQPDSSGDSYAWNPLAATALESGELQRGSLIYPAEALAREGESLAERARMDLVDTPAARPVRRSRLDDGMAQGAALPVLGPDGPAGVLVALRLLNRRYDVVDDIRNLLFHEETDRGRPIGMATLFQDDVRIATNVPTQSGERAAGTRMSEAVYRRTIERGEVYADKAFVVNDWYVSAYEPIHDSRGAIIGALYVGLLEAPIVQPRRALMAAFLLMAFIASSALLASIAYLLNRMLGPIAAVIAASKRIVEGDLSARVGLRPANEMGLICEAVDRMAQAAQERETLLKENAMRQLGQSEKLASIGRLAAGVAHELNNPLTGVLTFAHLLREQPNLSDRDREDLGVIIHETTRMKDIVRGLLDFAREAPAGRAPLQLNEIVERTVRLIRGNREFSSIVIQTGLDENLPEIGGDANQLQQVVLNLCMNACEAMAETGGELYIRTGRSETGESFVSVRDDGCGIDPERLETIFDPFYTTKPVGKGTGLGLSVSYGIAHAHQGRIEVESQLGAGSTFTLFLPPPQPVTPVNQHKEPDPDE